jgi:Kinesin motor domain
LQVIIRVRPPLSRELSGWRPYQNTVDIDPDEKAVTLNENLPAHPDQGGASDGMLYASYRFTFDHVFGPMSSQEEMYRRAARSAVTNALDGYNAAIIAYGQTGTGKTYTMEGERTSMTDRGIVPRAIQDIFAQISAEAGPHNQYLVRASYLQIYNEVISDLLKADRTNLTIR